MACSNPTAQVRACCNLIVNACQAMMLNPAGLPHRLAVDFRGDSSA